MNFSLKRKLRGKGGSSLPMVLAIGLVLVVWVMGLSPIVATQGKASIDVQQQEEDYLQSRSAIEFTKGELVNMVDRRGRPMTFAVVKGAVQNLAPDATEDQFTPIIFETNRPLYENYVEIELGSLTGKGAPQDSDLGDEVCAICHVEKPSGSSRDYKINVTTYANGEANLTYSTTYTPPLSAATIYPEAYKKTDALPISDFVVVDGKLGEKVLWDSPLTNGTINSVTSSSYINGAKGEDFAYASGFSELLLGIDETGKYSDAGSYPAVFKVTAEAALRIAGGTEGDSITDVNTSMVTPLEAPSLNIYKISNNGSSVTVTLNSSALSDTTHANHVLFGYSTTSASNITWSRSQTITLPGEGSYYFYCYITGHAVGNTLYANSAIQSTTRPITVINYSTSNLKTGGGSTSKGDLRENTPYIVGTKESNAFRYLYASGGLETSTLSAGMNVFTNYETVTNTSGTSITKGDTPIWTLEQTGTSSVDIYWKFEYNNTNKGINYSDPLFAKKSFSYSSDMSSLRVGERISSHFITYMDLYSDRFVGSSSGNSSKIYFYQVPTNSGGTPGHLAYTNPNNVNKVTVDHDETMDAIYEEFYRTVVPSATANSLNLYFSYQSENTYIVYGTWTQGGLPYYAQLCQLIINQPAEGDADALSGFVMAGQSLYFMGEGAAIDTNGETVNLLCDLLVIRDDISTGDSGKILVRPHSGAASGQTLVFFVNGTGPFKDHNFYLVNARTDLAAVTADDFGTSVFHVCDAYGCYDPACDGSVVRSGEIITKFSAAVVDMSTLGYPTVNLDIAYATNEQLGHIVSSEAIGWTVDGVMDVDSTTDNALYVVCAYVKSLADNIKCSANRIMLASEGDFEVTEDMALYARYISFDAGVIQQVGSGTKLEVYSLLENRDLVETIIQFIQNLVGTNADFNSGTLQVEYEQVTEVLHDGVAPGDGIKVNADIFRYKSGTDLFSADLTEEEEDGADAAQQQLRVSYDTADFMEAFTDAYHLHTVERYMDITESVKLDMPIEKFLFSVPVERHLNLYSNFISFDESVTKIELGEYTASAFGYELYSFESDIIINTQESGYTEEEYLGFFRTNSADTYNGTILQVKGDKIVISRGSQSYELENGFYYVEAQTDGTSLFEVAKNADDHYITNEEMLEYAQSLSDNHAYVDTGLETSEMSAGGFGGGSVN